MNDHRPGYTTAHALLFQGYRRTLSKVFVRFWNPVEFTTIIGEIKCFLLENSCCESTFLQNRER